MLSSPQRELLRSICSYSFVDLDHILGQIPDLNFKIEKKKFLSKEIYYMSPVDTLVSVLLNVPMRYEDSLFKLKDKEIYVHRRERYFNARPDGIELLKKMISLGASPNGANRFESPLSHAALNGCLDIMRALIEARANLDVVGDDGNTPLHLACSSPSKTGKNCFSTAQLLIDAGAEINPQNDEKKTPLSVLLNQVVVKRWQEYYDTVEILIKNGADVNMVDINSVSPLLIASQPEQKPLKDIFERMGIRVDAAGSHHSPILIVNKNDTRFAASMGWRYLDVSRFDIPETFRRYIVYPPSSSTPYMKERYAIRLMATISVEQVLRQHKKVNQLKEPKRLHIGVKILAASFVGTLAYLVGMPIFVCAFAALGAFVAHGVLFSNRSVPSKPSVGNAGQRSSEEQYGPNNVRKDKTYTPMLDSRVTEEKLPKDRATQVAQESPKPLYEKIQ